MAAGPILHGSDERGHVIDQAELRRREYVGRVNRVMDHIRANLAGDLRLETLAQVANFSPYHFHRVFKAVVGETLNGYIRRVRAQSAAAQLEGNPTRTITEIAVRCGYSSSSAFAREFRQQFGVSASQFRADGAGAVARLRQKLEAGGAELLPQHPERTEMVFHVEVRDVSERHVAYLRHVGPYDEIGRSFARLMHWAGPRRLLRFPETKVLAIYHDHPGVTPVDRLRADACITVPEGTRPHRDIGTMTVAGGRFAVGYAEIAATQYGEAWDRLYADWMPESGYQPDDRSCYELYLNDPGAHPEAKHIVEIHQPIRPL